MQARDEIAEIARVLALPIAHYRVSNGDLSIKQRLEMLCAEGVNDAQAKVLAHQFGLLVEVLKALGPYPYGRMNCRLNAFQRDANPYEVPYCRQIGI